MKIAVITCYDQSDYVRTRTLRTAFAAAKGVETVVVKNSHKGVLRYAEVALKLLKLRFSYRPDAYVVTFRGYEMLFFMVMTLVRKPIIFDELINFVEYFEEHGKLKPGTRLDRFFRAVYGWMLRRCRIILADTQAHAHFSAKLCNVPGGRFRALPISADETIFRPATQKQVAKKPFNVFYYGNGMTPLHGLQYVLDAAVLLKDDLNITFTLVGGKQKAEQACLEAVRQGAQVTYKAWVPFEEIPKLAAGASLCLGGPFGKTLQSQFVVTGKAVQFLAVGRPVLIGQNKVSNMFVDRQNCLLVPLADTQAIAQAIRWAASHPAQLDAIGRQGRKLYDSHFSQAVVNKIVAGIVQDL